MKPFKLKWLCGILFSLALIPSYGQDTAVKKIAILPFHSMGMDPVAVKSAESILRLEIGKLSLMDIISEKRILQTMQTEICGDFDCALDFGKKLEADQVVLCQLTTLGQKIIVQYSLIHVPGGTTLIEDKIISTTVEDLDEVMKRVAMSLVELKPALQTAKIGAITNAETMTPRRREARKFSGFSFGYLYPQHGYDKSGRCFAMDFRMGAEIDDYSLGMQLLIRKGFGVNLFASYLFSRKDVCPYFGGALGFHWVSHTHYENYYNDYPPYTPYQEDNKRGDGFELTLNSGILLFHTYSLQVTSNLAYTLTINDYNDQAFVFTIGLVK